jgi:cation:H+ antiporter
MLDSTLVWFSFFALGSVIIVVGPRLSKYGDIIAAKTGMERSWVGVILLALVTSLPEVATSATAALIDLPDVVFGNVYGSNLFNLVIIAVLDILVAGPPPILERASRKNILISGFGIKMMAVSLLPLVLYNIPGLNFEPVKLFGVVDISSLILITVYVFGMRMIFQQENFESSEAIHTPVTEESKIDYDAISKTKAYATFIVLAIIIVAAGIGMSNLAETISTYEIPIGEGIPIGQSLVGIILLAVVTSLPELMVSIGAVRIGQIDMAIGNVLGSNMFNMLIIGVSDLFYTSGSILNRPTVTGPASIIGLSSHLLVALSGIIMLGLVTARLSFLPKSKKRICVTSWLLIIIFLLTYALLFKINFSQ